MQRAMKPVMPSILQDEENADLEENRCPGGKGNTGFHSEIPGHWMEKPDLRNLDGEVGEEDKFRADPLFFGSRDFLPLNLVLVKVRDFADYEPGQTAAKVD